MQQVAEKAVTRCHAPSKVCALSHSSPTLERVRSTRARALHTPASHRAYVSTTSAHQSNPLTHACCSCLLIADMHPLTTPRQPLIVDRKFNQVHFNLFSHPDSIFSVCFSIQNFDMPVMRLLVRFMLFLMEIILHSGLKPYVVISKAESCCFMSLVTVPFQNKWTKKLILPMPFGLRIGKVLIIISSLDFVIHLFHQLLMSLATLILPKKFGTYMLLGMLDRVVLATLSSHANFIRFVMNQVSGSLYITAI